jgi:putative membrane protein
MTRYAFMALSVGVLVIICPVGTDAAKKLDSNETAFLQKAAQEQLAEIALGNLAMKKASDKKVKELGAEMLEDHQYARQEIQGVSAQEGIYLPVDMIKTKESTAAVVP